MESTSAAIARVSGGSYTTGWGVARRLLGGGSSSSSDSEGGGGFVFFCVFYVIRHLSSPLVSSCLRSPLVFP